MNIELWKELIAESLDNHGVSATDEQIALIAKDASGIAESISEFSFRPADPMIRELEDTKAALERERDKVTCSTCKGTGYLISNGPCHSSHSSCWKCRGEGRHAPLPPGSGTGAAPSAGPRPSLARPSSPSFYWAQPLAA